MAPRPPRHTAICNAAQQLSTPLLRMMASLGAMHFNTQTVHREYASSPLHPHQISRAFAVQQRAFSGLRLMLGKICRAHPPEPSGPYAAFPLPIVHLHTLPAHEPGLLGRAQSLYCQAPGVALVLEHLPRKLRRLLELPTLTQNGSQLKCSELNFHPAPCSGQRNCPTTIHVASVLS